jgi:hypothetical protein
MTQETLRKRIQTRRHQTTSFGRVEDDPKNSIEMLINLTGFTDFD